MDGRFSGNRFVSEQEENDTTPENSSESPPSTTFNDMKMTSTSSPKKRLTPIHNTLNFFLLLQTNPNTTHVP